MTSQGIANIRRRREVLGLYRSMIRSAGAFYWSNEKGEQWSKVLRASARKEFEMNRHERDPLEVADLRRSLMHEDHATGDRQHAFDSIAQDRVAGIRQTRGHLVEKIRELH